MAGYYDIKIEQGATFTLPIHIMNSDGTDFDLTTWSKRGQIRRTHRTGTKIADFTFNVTDAVHGRMEICLTASVTATIVAGETESDLRGKYVYDIELYKSTPEEVKRLLNGFVYVSPEVTKE